MTDVHDGVDQLLRQAGSSARYEDRIDDNHHLICRGCDTMFDIYWGQCPTCRIR